MNYLETAPRRGLVLLQAKGLATRLKLKRLRGGRTSFLRLLRALPPLIRGVYFERAFFFQRTAQDIKGIDEGQPRHGTQLHGLDERQVRFPPGTDDGGEDGPEQGVEKAGNQLCVGRRSRGTERAAPGTSPIQRGGD